MVNSGVIARIMSVGLNGNGGNMHRLSRHSPAITAISCLMAMLWIPAAQGQTLVNTQESVTWMGRLLALPVSALNPNGKNPKISIAPTTARRHTATWMPHGLSLWGVTTVHVLHNGHHARHLKIEFSVVPGLINIQSGTAMATILPPQARHLQVFTARPPPAML